MRFAGDREQGLSGKLPTLPAVSFGRNLAHIHNVYQKVQKTPEQNFIQQLPVTRETDAAGNFTSYERVPKYQVVLSQYQRTPSSRQKEGLNTVFLLDQTQRGALANLPMFFTDEKDSLILTKNAFDSGKLAFFATGALEQVKTTVSSVPLEDVAIQSYIAAASNTHDKLLQLMTLEYNNPGTNVKYNTSDDIYLVVPMYPSVNAKDGFLGQLNKLDPTSPNIHPFDIRYPSLQPVLVGKIIMDRNDKSVFYVDTILRGDEVLHCDGLVQVPFSSFCLVYQLSSQGRAIEVDRLFRKVFNQGNQVISDIHRAFFEDVIYQIGQVLETPTQGQINTNGAENVSTQTILQNILQKSSQVFAQPGKQSSYRYLIPELLRVQTGGRVSTGKRRGFEQGGRGGTGPTGPGFEPSFNPPPPPPSAEEGTGPKSEMGKQDLYSARRPVFGILVQAYNAVRYFYSQNNVGETATYQELLGFIENLNSNLAQEDLSLYQSQAYQLFYSLMQEVSQLYSSSMTTAQDLRMSEALALYSNKIPTETMETYKANQLMGNFAKFPNSGYQDQLSETMTQVQDLQRPEARGGEIRAPFKLRLEVFAGEDPEPFLFVLDSRTGLKSKYFEEGENVRYAIHYAKIGEDRKQIASKAPLKYATITRLRATFSAGPKTIFKRSFKTDVSEQPAVVSGRLNDFVLQANAMNTYEPVRRGARQDTMTLLLKQSFEGTFNSVTNLESVALLHKISFASG